MCRDPAIGATEKAMSERKLAQRRQRPGPPDLAGKEQNGVGSAEDFAGGGEHFHLLERGGGVKIELALHPWGLKRHKFKTTGTEERPALPGRGHAVPALTVVENPGAASGANGRSVWRLIAIFCLFCLIRNVLAKNFHRGFTPRSFSVLSPSRASLTRAGVGRRSIWVWAASASSKKLRSSSRRSCV